MACEMKGYCSQKLMIYNGSFYISGCACYEYLGVASRSSVPHTESVGYVEKRAEA